jgi:hypothetical protein
MGIPEGRFFLDARKFGNAAFECFSLGHGVARSSVAHSCGSFGRAIEDVSELLIRLSQ